jgi:S1-C subfamily serine protease
MMKSIKHLSLILFATALVAGGVWRAGWSPARADVIVQRGGGAVVSVDEGDDGPVVHVIGDDTGYLGVNIEEEVDHPEGGARVIDVVDGSPADEAGLREGDIIVEFDGHVVRGPTALTRRIHEREPGDKVRLKIVRDGAAIKLEVELGKRSDLWKPLRLGEQAWVLPDVADRLQELQFELGDLELEKLNLDLEKLDLGDLGERIREGFAPLRDCEEDDCFYVYGLGNRPKLGVQLVEATPELRHHLGGSKDAGVLVSKVLTGTPAERAGIQVGDLIVSVAGDEIEDVADLRRALGRRAGETFGVEVIREGRALTVEVTLPESEDDDAPGPRAGLVAPFVAPLDRIGVASVPRAVVLAPRPTIAPAPPQPPQPNIEPPSVGPPRFDVAPPVAPKPPAPPPPARRFHRRYSV